MDVRGSRRHTQRDEVAFAQPPNARLSVWVKADRLHPLVPRGTKRFKDLYCERGAVEREFGHLKHEWAMLPLRVRRIDRVRMHTRLSILTRLAVRLDKERNAQETHGLASAA
jgi:hypothetical protein